MRDAILIVCGGLLQVPAVEAARDLGLAVIMTDRNTDAAAMHLADEAVGIDIYDVEAHKRLVDDVRTRWNLVGVFAEGADVEVTVAEAAAHAGLPGISPEAAHNTKNKVRSRERLQAAGIPNPTWREVTSMDEALRAADEIGFPLVVKALDNSASRGTTVVEGRDTLFEAFEVAVAASTTRTALLEGLMRGSEHSCEILLMRGGPTRRLNIVDRPFDYSGGFAFELGHVNPSRLSAAVQDEVFALTERAAAAVGVDFGAFKADMMVTADGPRIIEVTARLSGGFDCQYTTPLATGRNFIRAAMCLAIGRPVDEADLTPTRHRYAAAWVSQPTPGRVDRIGDMSRVLQLPGVAHVFLRVAEGETILPYRDCGARPAFVIATGNSWDDAAHNAAAAAREIPIVTSPVSA
jgi:biotin carboxylase